MPKKKATTKKTTPPVTTGTKGTHKIASKRPSNTYDFDSGYGLGGYFINSIELQDQIEEIQKKHNITADDFKSRKDLKTAKGFSNKQMDKYLDDNKIYDKRKAYGADLALIFEDAREYGLIKTGKTNDTYKSSHDPKGHFGAENEIDGGMGAFGDLVYHGHYDGKGAIKNNTKGSGTSAGLKFRTDTRGPRIFTGLSEESAPNAEEL